MRKIRKNNSAGKKFKIPKAVMIAVCLLPAVLTALFYIFRKNSSVMNWVVLNISAPVRGFFGLISSVYPFSLMEVVCTAAIVWLIYYIVRTVMVTVRRRGKWKILSKRLLVIAVAALYVWGSFCWLWNSGYYAASFTEINGLESGGVKTSDLIAVTRLFAKKANELAPLVKRDDEGFFIEDRREFFQTAPGVYAGITDDFPCLTGRLYRPKRMLFSWVMSRTGYTGIYFALTGESNINTRAPGCLMPSTVAHELAHQRGVFAEDEANFVGIAACVTSGNVVYEYSGWLYGLMNLSSALAQADREAYNEIHASLCSEVRLDWNHNYEYWQSQKKVVTGITFFDKILTAIVETASDTVDTVYNGYLKSNDQDLGIKSYGACVDLLAVYFLPSA